MRIAGEHIDIEFNVKRIDKDHVKITIKEDLADFDFLKDLTSNCWHFNIKSRSNDDLYCKEEVNLSAASFVLNLQDCKEWVLKCENFYKEIPFNFRGNNYYEELYFLGNGYEIVLRVAEECFNAIDWSPVRKYRDFYLEFFSDEKSIIVMLSQKEKKQLFDLIKKEIEKDFVVKKKRERPRIYNDPRYKTLESSFSDEYFFTNSIEKDNFIKYQNKHKRLFIYQNQIKKDFFVRDELFSLIWDFMTKEQQSRYHKLSDFYGYSDGDYKEKTLFINEKNKIINDEEVIRCFFNLEGINEKIALISTILFGYDFYKINLDLAEKLLNIWKEDFLKNNPEYQNNKDLLFEYSCINLFIGTLFAFKEDYLKAVYHFELALKTNEIFLYSDDVYRKLDYFVPVVPLVNKRGRDENPSKDRILNLCYSHYILSIYEKLKLYKDNAEIYNKKDIGFTKDNPAALVGYYSRDVLKHCVFDNIIGKNGNIIVNFSTNREKLESKICEYDVMLIDKDYKLTKATLYFYKESLDDRNEKTKIYLPHSFKYKRFNEKAADFIFIENKSILDEFVKCSGCGKSLGVKPKKTICSDCAYNEFKKFKTQTIKECEKLFKNKDSSVHTFYFSKFEKIYEGISIDKSKFKKDLFLGLIDWEEKTSHILFIPANSINEEKLKKVYGDQSLCRMEFLEEPFLYDRINELDFSKFLVKTIKYKRNK